jgi:plasmid stabilization system protein ParE
MDSAPLQVRLTDSALHDLHEIDDYWFQQGEPERGEQYVRDLIEKAEQELATVSQAQRGRTVRVAILPDTREILVFKNSYRIIYRIDAAEHVVHVLRFWHSHRDESELVRHIKELP